MQVKISFHLEKPDLIFEKKGHLSNWEEMYKWLKKTLKTKNKTKKTKKKLEKNTEKFWIWSLKPQVTKYENHCQLFFLFPGAGRNVQISWKLESWLK